MSKRLLKNKFLLIIVVCTIVFSSMYIFNNVNTVNKKIESIDYSEMISVGGIDQYIQITGDDINNPIILFLHGGPGFAQSSFANQYQNKLIEHFVVVNWDQRGAGKSYTDDIAKDTMHIVQFISDTDGVVSYLLEKFNREKIYLVGHSWGSILGLMTVKRHPEKFYAYIGIGQVINSTKGEEISYEFILDEAKNSNNTKALNEIMDIGYPPYNNMKNLSIERKWVTNFGGSFRNVNVYKALEESLDKDDYIGHQKGTAFSVSNLLPEIMKIDFFESIKEIKVPAYFCMGRYDYHTPSQMVEEYIKVLKAPKKELVWFEESAHNPNFEESDKFADILVKIKNETYND